MQEDLENINVWLEGWDSDIDSFRDIWVFADIKLNEVNVAPNKDFKSLSPVAWPITYRL